MYREYSVAFWILLTSAILGALLVQHELPLRCDVAYLLTLTQSLLAGGKYGVDIFETNPPMILYLYLPPFLLSKVSHISLETSLRLYVFTLIIISTMLSYTLLKKLITDKYILYALIGSILLVFNFLPSYQFGQREHLFLIMIMPYVFSSICMLEQKAIHPRLQLGIGILAGLGFCIKPYFLFPLILIELFSIYKKRHFFAWIRIETITILAILITYLATTYLFHPAYFTVLLPLIKQFYFPTQIEPWNAMLSMPIVRYCLITVGVYYAIRSEICHRLIGDMLALATIGTILTFAVTRTTWFYHTIPAYGFACLLSAFMLAELIKPTSIKKAGLFILLGIFFFDLPVTNAVLQTKGYIHEKREGGNKKLADYLATLPGKHSVMCFSPNTTIECFPLVINTHSTYASRYPFFWWIRSVIQLTRSTQPLPHETQARIDFLIDNVAYDLNRFQARWIIINREEKNSVLGKGFDYGEFLSRNEGFREAWGHYRYLISIANYDVYERS